MCPFRLDVRTLTIEGPLGRVELANLHPPAEPPSSLAPDLPVEDA
jgi:hypothetical protein